MESHLQSDMGLHLDLTCTKLNNTQIELKNARETIRKLEEVELKNAQEAIRKLQEKLHTRKMVWKIDEFSRIMREAKRELKMKIESDPFYTEIPGYKLKALFFPNGCGSGRNTHLSVSIVVMKGEYDAILSWPFNMKVKFTLIDQEEDPLKRENVVFKFTPDNFKYTNFFRPKGSENTGRGKLQFISHLKLQERRYIVDDTLFLQVEIDPI